MKGDDMRSTLVEKEDAKASELADGDDTSDSQWVEDRCALAEEVLRNMLKAMQEGWYAEWVERYFSDDLHFVVAGKFADPSEDRACLGKMSFLQHYNNMIQVVWSADTDWAMVGDVRVLSSETCTSDWRVRMWRDGQEVEMLRRFTTSLRDDGVYYVMVSGVDSSEDMSPGLLLSRSCVPDNGDVPRPPCPHNSWDSIRAKKTITMMRCRVCFAPWNLPAHSSHLFRCAEFLTDSCPHAPTSCRRLHIHNKKRRRHELEGTPTCQRPAADNTPRTCPVLPLTKKCEEFLKKKKRLEKRG
ncbi:hypothetical protein DIPPA_27214 [Diplonema papillatum]|nr:hypothetical protein DIPPA_27214 [Diplonema papillatum]